MCIHKVCKTFFSKYHCCAEGFGGGQYDEYDSVMVCTLSSINNLAAFGPIVMINQT